MNRPEGQDGPDTEGIALAQGDLSINLFIVLLIILSVLTVAQVSSGNQGYRAPYFQGPADDTAGPPVLGWQPLLPAYPKLVLRGGRVYLVPWPACRRLRCRRAAGSWPGCVRHVHAACR